jgi:hypothetical protein
MSNPKTPILDQTLKAFTYHQAVSIRKKDGGKIDPGYIMIMYGNTSFRMQSKDQSRESHLISVGDIDEISVEGEEKTFF